MTQMSKGSNIELSATRIRAELVWEGHPTAPDVDASALLLAPSGKVRSDDDFVFFNQPNHASGAIRKMPKQTVAALVRDALEIDLTRIEGGIDRIVLGSSADGGTFGQVPGLHLLLTDLATNAQIARFDMTDATSETAFLSGEFYRRGAAWKFRAVGQGYAAGLEGLATDFGITVDDAPAAPVAPVAPPVPVTPPAVTPPTVTRPTMAPPAATFAWPGTSPTPATPVPAAPIQYTRPAAPAPVPVPAGTVNLDKGRVNLQKNQRVSLVKTGAPALSRIQLGLGWDPAVGSKAIDLDASAIVLNAAGKDIDLAWFMSKKACKGAIRHMGDNVTGQGEGDDEVIVVDLEKVPADAAAIVFTINSFSSHKFTDIKNAYCRLVDAVTGAELVRFDLTDSKPSTGVFMCVLRRAGAAWEMEGLGAFHDGRTVKAMRDPAAAYVRPS